MSLLDDFKCKLLKPVTVEPKRPDITVMTMAVALNGVVKEQEEFESKLQTLIIDNFGFSAAATVSECVDLWNTAPLSESPTLSVDQSNEKEWAEDAANAHKALDRSSGKSLSARIGADPVIGAVVIMQKGMGKVVDLDLEHGNVMIQNHEGVERVFARDQLLGPKKIHGKVGWALKTALPKRA